jgi:hypothetical protein
LKKSHTLNNFIAFSIRIYVQQFSLHRIRGIKNATPYTNFIPLKKLAELHQNFCPEPEPHKNDAAQQHCI